MPSAVPSMSERRLQAGKDALAIIWSWCEKAGHESMREQKERDKREEEFFFKVKWGHLEGKP